MFEDIYIQTTSSVIEMSILEPNNKLTVSVELGEIHCAFTTRSIEVYCSHSPPDL